MRLSKANADKLTALVWRERARKFGLIGGAVAVVVGGVIAITSYRASHSDPVELVTVVNATVTQKDTTRTSRTGYIFKASLPDGHEIDAFATSGFAPPPGTKVVLGQARHKSGKLTYDLIRLAQ